MYVTGKKQPCNGRMKQTNWKEFQEQTHLSGEEDPLGTVQETEIVL